jgi:hypothetical protein
MLNISGNLLYSVEEECLYYRNVFNDRQLLKRSRGHVDWMSVRRCPKNLIPFNCVESDTIEVSRSLTFCDSSAMRRYQNVVTTIKKGYPDVLLVAHLAILPGVGGMDFIFYEPRMDLYILLGDRQCAPELVKILEHDVTYAQLCTSVGDEYEITHIEFTDYSLDCEEESDEDSYRPQSGEFKISADSTMLCAICIFVTWLIIKIHSLLNVIDSGHDINLPFLSFSCHSCFPNSAIPYCPGSPEDISQNSVHELLSDHGFTLRGREFRAGNMTCDLHYFRDGTHFAVEAKARGEKSVKMQAMTAAQNMANILMTPVVPVWYTMVENRINFLTARVPDPQNYTPQSGRYDISYSQANGTVTAHSHEECEHDQEDFTPVVKRKVKDTRRARAIVHVESDGIVDVFPDRVTGDDYSVLRPWLVRMGCSPMSFAEFNDLPYGNRVSYLEDVTQLCYLNRNGPTSYRLIFKRLTGLHLNARTLAHPFNDVRIPCQFDEVMKYEAPMKGSKPYRSPREIREKPR